MTYPVNALPAFEVDFDDLFGAVQLYVQDARKIRSQPPLQPENSLLIGQEALPQFVSAPAIWIVPRGAKVKPVRRNGRTDFDPIPFFSQWLLFECHCWGDDDPQQLSQNYSFSSSLELARQLVCAFVEQAKGGEILRGEAHTLIESFEYRQKTDVNRQGRMVVFTLAQEAYLVKDPPIRMPIATPTIPGVQISMQTSMGTPPPGTSEPADNPIRVPTGPNG